jgi:hypothetical protein
MTTSKTIAGLIGPTLVALAAGMLLNIGSFRALAERVFPRPRAHHRHQVGGDHKVDNQKQQQHEEADPVECFAQTHSIFAGKG